MILCLRMCVSHSIGLDLDALLKIKFIKIQDTWIQNVIRIRNYN